MRPPSKKKLQAMVDDFNDRVKFGDEVLYYSTLPLPLDCEPIRTKTRSRATVFCGHSAVVWLEGVAGCVSVTHVEPVK